MGQNKFRDGQQTKAKSLSRTHERRKHTFKSSRKTRNSDKPREQGSKRIRRGKARGMSHTRKEENEILQCDGERSEVKKTAHGSVGE